MEDELFEVTVDEFAESAMAELIPIFYEKYSWETRNELPEIIAETAYNIADAMVLEQLRRQALN